MTHPFHLSFRVEDLDRTRAFYEGTLGCTIGRATSGWFDIDFFGHQVTVHQGGGVPGAPGAYGPSRKVLDHFGVILPRADWEDLLRMLESGSVEFRVPPARKNVGQADESAKFVVVDPDGFGLEFKYHGDSTARIEKPDD